jgi:glycosyltransferase involved in cell wall biosynthesis
MVSIIVPGYNIKKYLSKCFDSLLGESFTDIEIIIINDGSTDNCGAIIDHYAKIDSRIKSIYKINGGQS